MRRTTAILAAAGLAFATAAAANHNSSHATACNEADTAGGGTLGNSPGWPTPGLGWDVGSGQCNGSFTLSSDSAFPSADGDGIELAIRIEQRRVGQVANGGGDYEVMVGDDPGTGGSRAWWNFQHSIAYDGDINSLDALTFDIRVDAGSSVPTTPADMLAIRSIIDDRHPTANPGDPFKNPTATYSDLYQTSQNPVFGWFSTYDMFEEGAWKLTLTAEKDGQTASVSICVHTPNAVCIGDVAIDLRPNNATNQINTNARQQVPIAILGTESFDPCTEVDLSSVMVRGAQPSQTKYNCTDVSGDGVADLVIYLRARALAKPTAEECSDPSAMIELTGSTTMGEPILGTDHVSWKGPDCP